MPRRLKTVSAALVFAFMAYALQSVALPGRVLACSCVTPLPSLAELVDRDQITVVVGIVGQALPDRTPIAVEAWFYGEAATDLVWLSGGANEATSCDVFMSVGEHRLLVLQGGADGLYSTNVCLPGGLIGTPEVDARLAEAAGLFGVAQSPPPAPEPAPNEPLDLSPWLGGLTWVAAAAGVAILMFGALALFARRRPSG